MNKDELMKQLKAKREELKSCLATISELSAKHIQSQAEGSKVAALTDDEKKAWGDSLDKAEALKTDIERIEKELSLGEFASQDAPEKRGIQYDRQEVGRDVIRVADDGRIRLQDRIGSSIGTKAAQMMAEPSYHSAYERYLRGHADSADLQKLQEVLVEASKTMREGLDADGGFLAPPTIIWEIIKPDPAPTSLFDMVRQLPSGSDTLKLPKLDYVDTDDIWSNPMRFQYDGEEDAPTEGDTPKWGMHEIPIHGGKMEFPVTRYLLSDAAVPIEEVVSEEFRDSFRLSMESRITTNDAAYGPRGFLVGAGTAGNIPTVDMNDPVDGDGLLALHGALPAQYRAGSSYVMQQEDTYTTLSQIKNAANDEYIFGKLGFQDRGLAGSLHETLLGKSIFMNPFMPTPATNAKLIGYANWRKLYVFSQHTALQILRQDLPREAYVWFVMRARNGGKVVQPRAGRIGVQA